jgi:hypothetical protein
MKTSLLALALTLLVGLTGACGARSPAPRSAQEPVVAALDGGRGCTSSGECGPGELCVGPAGCGLPWSCVPERPCTMDLAMFCSCEGQTVRGSSSCPPEPYQHVGECD